MFKQVKSNKLHVYDLVPYVFIEPCYLFRTEICTFLLLKQKVYKEDWEDQKSMVYFPYTITPEYETKSSVTRHDVSLLTTTII